MPLSRPLRRSAGRGVHRTVALLSLLIATVPAALGAAQGPAVAAPSYTLADRALAIASPSLVYLETVYTGYVLDKQTNQPVLPAPVTYNRRCSGFVVNAEGDVVTTRTCVAPSEDTLHQQVLRAAASKLLNENKMPQGQFETWISEHMGTTVIGGLTDSSKPDAKLFAQFGIATGGVTDKPAVRGSVVKLSDSDTGDVAVVKLDQGNLPAVELDTGGGPTTGTQLLVLGFNTVDSDPRVGTYTLESQSVQIVSSATAGSTTYYRLNKTVGTYYAGGMAIDMSGRVVGIVDQTKAGEYRAVYPISTATTVLGAAGVHNALGDADRLYRGGLDAYFAGRYTTAIADLDKVSQTVPTNHVASVYRQNAMDRQQIEGKQSGGGTGWVWILVAAVGGAVLAAGAVLVAMRVRARRRRWWREESGWERRYTSPPAPPVAPAAGVPWTPLGPVSAPPTSAPPSYASSLPVSSPPVSSPPVSSPPVSSPPVSSPPVAWPPVSPSVAPSAAPDEPDLGVTQRVAWPPPSAMPVTPGEGPAPESPDLPTESVPGPAVSPAVPAPAAEEQPAPRTEPIVWQQKPTRRSVTHEDPPEGGERPTSPWAAPPPQH
jgi:Trypsin-like peptidase domain